MPGAEQLVNQLVTIIFTTAKYLLYLSPVIVLAGIAAFLIRGKILYNYPVRIFRTRENGKVLEKNCKGGFIQRKNSAPYFRIKFGPFWWQKKDLNSTPKTALMDEQNRVYYNQIDIDTFVQMKREFNPDKKVKFTPVDSDVKYGAILDIQKIRDVTAKKDTLMKYLGWGALMLIAVIHLVVVLVVLKG